MLITLFYTPKAREGEGRERDGGGDFLHPYLKPPNPFSQSNTATPFSTSDCPLQRCLHSPIQNGVHTVVIQIRHFRTVLTVWKLFWGQRYPGPGK